MNVENAYDIIQKKMPERKILGFWAKPGEIIVNVAPFPDEMGCTQFIVKDENTVIPTNPFRSKLTPQGYKEFKPMKK